MSSESSIKDTNFDYFLHASTIWLNWSYMDFHWEDKHSNSNETRKHKAIRLTLAYPAGMVGHFLIGVTKVIQCSLFIIISSGLFFYFLALKIVLYAEKNPQKQELLKNSIHICKYRVYESLLIVAGSVGAVVVDGVGVICPPLAYKIHNFMQNEIIVKALNHMGIIGPNQGASHNLAFYAHKFHE